MLHRLLILLALLLAPALGHARGIDPQLVAEGPAPAGGEVELAIVMHTKPGWHGYWLNPGDAGLPMQVKWKLPKGWSVGDLQYPVPTRLTIAGLMNYVYEKDYAVLLRLKAPANASGAVPIRAEAHWLACTDKICVPESGELSLEVPVGSGTPNRAQFDQWRKALPRPLASVAHFEVAGDKIRLGIPLPRDVKVEKPYVFPAADGPVDYAGEQHFSRKDDLLIAELPRRNGEPQVLPAVLALGDGRGLQIDAVPGAVPDGGTPIGSLGMDALLWAVLGAILGGILLNLMPCVFPILALKALHLARSGGEARHARRDALAYAAGAIVGTGALGVALVAIRAGGSAAGWAFQLQDPRTIMLLLLLATAITANLVHLFELPTVGGGRGQPEASGPERLRRSSRPRAPDRSSVRHWGQLSCFRWLVRLPCSPRLVWVLHCLLSRSPSFRRFGAGFRHRARGWPGFSDSSRFRWERQRSQRFGYCTGRPDSAACGSGSPQPRSSWPPCSSSAGFREKAVSFHCLGSGSLELRWLPRSPLLRRRSKAVLPRSPGRKSGVRRPSSDSLRKAIRPSSISPPTGA
jgi:DsbC/DsbD-like thiol-disulfide interchange protein/cytochrome c biogenesis protein CcdA